MADSGRLTIVPTPIGNLGDITLRAIEALRSADAVLCEDTRVTGKLLTALDVRRPLVRLDEYTIRDRSDQIIAQLQAGESFAYCSDAGMPGVSDPGMHLVSQARKQGIPVDVLPGASAVTTAYVASGFSAQRFLFAGFLPRKEGERAALLESLASLDAALIFYESPHRIADSLGAIAQAFPTRQVALCRELTKVHEEVIVEQAPKLAEHIASRQQEAPLKGEIALVIDAPSAEEEVLAQDAKRIGAQARAEELTAAGTRPKEAAQILSRECGIPRNEAYELTLSARDRLREGSSA